MLVYPRVFVCSISMRTWWFITGFRGPRQRQSWSFWSTYRFWWIDCHLDRKSKNAFWYTAGHPLFRQLNIWPVSTGTCNWYIYIYMYILILYIYIPPYSMDWNHRYVFWKSTQRSCVSCNRRRSRSLSIYHLWRCQQGDEKTMGEWRMTIGYYHYPLVI